MVMTHFGDYELLRPLGRGALGQTYLAEHRLLQKQYIVKILPEELSSDANFIARFETHIAQLAHLNHPHIAKIYNALFLDKRYAIIIEAILDEDQQPSLNLSQFLQKFPDLPEETILCFAQQVSSALDYAHSQEKPLAHGTLKLSNILVRYTSKGPEAIVTDFGLSHIIGPLAVLSRIYHAMSSFYSLEIGCDTNGRNYVTGPWDEACAKEVHRSFVEQFPFLAPEQKKQFNWTSQPKADVWAFGVLLYYLLTRKFPEGFFELPSQKISDLKWQWDALICSCLQTEPEMRLGPLQEKMSELVNISALSSCEAHLERLQAEKYIMGTKVSFTTACHAKPILNPQELIRPSFEPDPGAIFQTEMTVSPYKPKPQAEKAIQPILTDMVIIPSGVYLRGSNQGARDEHPRHSIHMHSFALDVHPVTNEQFARFLEAMGGEKDGQNNDIIRLRESKIKRSGGKLSIESGYAKHPVVGITWYGAIAYAKWIGKRLPTEAEWEIASYGGKEDFLYPTGQDIDRAQANFFSSDTTAMLSYPPNEYGLHDMAGNVYEWCQDWYDYQYYDLSIQEPNHPQGPPQGVYRVLRGGCWKSLKEDLRCAHRHRNNPGTMNGTYGFRCAADVAIHP